MCVSCTCSFFGAQPGYGLRAAGSIRDYFLAGKRIKRAQGMAWLRLIFCQQPQLSLNPSLWGNWDHTLSCAPGSQRRRERHIDEHKERMREKEDAKKQEREAVLKVREIKRTKMDRGRDSIWLKKKWNWATNHTRKREFMIMIVNSWELSSYVVCKVPNPHYWHLNTHPERHILLWIPLWERCIFCMIWVGMSVWKTDRHRRFVCVSACMICPHTQSCIYIWFFFYTNYN